MAGTCFPGFGSSLRVAGDSELSASTRNYRWLAVSLRSDAEYEPHKPVSVGGQKSSYSAAVAAADAFVNNASS